MMPDTCIHVISHGSWHVDPTPDETCDADVVPGTDFCPTHHGMNSLFDGPEADAAYDDWRDEQAELDRLDEQR